ncbi:penicillin acylase family protein [bacterium]|nr:penicillin acylase family protein [bacterium]
MRWYRKEWFKRIFKSLLVIVIAGVAWVYVRKTVLRPSIPKPGAAVLERVKNVTIKRDTLGVPHIFGKTDADTAFGLAYAHAEDDYPIIQGSLAAARGQLALLLLKKIGIANDFMVRLLNINKKVNTQYETLLSPDVKVLLEAYADGLNYYAYLHPDEVDSRLLPFTGRDVVSGFIHKLSIFVGVGSTLEDLMGREPVTLKSGLSLQRIKTSRADLPDWTMGIGIGSNSHAVGPNRSADHITRLNINSHQPYEGAVAWYEAHLVSEEGWNVIGGTFPGAPFILHGHNQYLGWAHTVNKPDGIDVYELEMHPDGGLKYRFDGEWKDLEVVSSNLVIDIGLFNLPIPRDFYRSVHGPVLKLDERYFAIRYVGEGQIGLAAEQWYRMNKATSMDEWKKAMSIQGIPMMNTMYADKDNILYVYNHLLPVRNEQYDWLTILPGNTSETLWTEYLPFSELPMAENPPSGYLVNTNSTPFQATLGEGNPDPETFSRTLGIETNLNNRARRSHELFGADDSITREEFIEYKFDQAYSRSDRLFTQVLNPLLDTYQPQSDEEKKALEILKQWDGVADMDSVGATLVNLIYRPIFKESNKLVPGVTIPTPEEAFRDAVKFLMEHYKRVDVPLGEVQRLRRGKTDLPLAGSMDVLNAVHTEMVEGHLVGTVGDSYILIVEFDKNGARSWGRHQYGNVNRKDSVHYDDQALDFTHLKLKKSLLTREEIEANLEQSYHPGEETEK